MARQLTFGERGERQPAWSPGKTAEVVFYPREGHDFSEYYHQLDRLKRQYEWITKYTLGDPGRKPTAP